MDEVKKQLWDKLQDDIAELNEWLQKLLEVWVNKWSIQEEEVISEIDDMDWNIKLLEKFYALTEKLWIKVVTIEEALEQEQEITKKETKLWKVSLYGGKTDNSVDNQYKDYIKLYFIAWEAIKFYIMIFTLGRDSFFTTGINAAIYWK